ncbi:hypothetical protein [Glycomyces sp. YM15]|uniref:hypothetical protein n=1 Tax=Glycomyces sp. YM15 TaxID=2800446 RepID=UPI00196631B0|nr:hypothetical protein [Glycomyces sp. YM15]
MDVPDGPWIKRELEWTFVMAAARTEIQCQTFLVVITKTAETAACDFERLWNELQNHPINRQTGMNISDLDLI